MGDDLNERIARAREKLEGQKRPSASRAGNDMGLGLRMATDFVAAIIVGLVVGWGIDAVFKVAPWGLIICLMFGVATGMWNVIRQANAAQARSGPPGQDLPASEAAKDEEDD